MQDSPSRAGRSTVSQSPHQAALLALDRPPRQSLIEVPNMLASRILRAASSSSTIASAAAGASSLARAKATTEMTGLAVHPTPINALQETYTKTLSLLEALPSESVYRQATQALTQSRLEAVKKVQSQHQSAFNSGDKEQVEQVIVELESTIDAGQIEEVILQAQDEIKLAAKMLEWKSHEPLEVPAPAHQWTYFSMEEEAATNE